LKSVPICRANSGPRAIFDQRMRRQICHWARINGIEFYYEYMVKARRWWLAHGGRGGGRPSAGWWAAGAGRAVASFPLRHSRPFGAVGFSGADLAATVPVPTRSSKISAVCFEPSRQSKKRPRSPAPTMGGGTRVRLRSLYPRFVYTPSCFVTRPLEWNECGGDFREQGRRSAKKINGKGGLAQVLGRARILRRVSPRREPAPAFPLSGKSRAQTCMYRPNLWPALNGG